MKMVKLVLIRHGQSIANQDNVYTGWSDVPLTDLGRQQARQAGQLLQQTGLQFMAIHTSVLSRAIVTANLVAEEIGQLATPIYKSWRLNERHYGALRGLNKEATKQQYGAKQVALWRRSFDSIPPKLSQPDTDRRYDLVPWTSRPLAESLAQCQKRLLPYWQDQIAPRLLQGQNQLVVAHGSSLRALIKYLEEISDQDIDGLEVENGQPLLYDLDDCTLAIRQKIVLG